MSAKTEDKILVLQLPLIANDKASDFLHETPNLYYLIYTKCVTSLSTIQHKLINSLMSLFEQSAFRDRLRERALIEGVAWPPQFDFWMRRGCYKDFAAYVGRTMRLRLEEEALHREL